MKKQQLTIGILGGMGPLATIDFFHKIVKNTPASCDQDHLRILIDNNPKIPDRNAAIAGEGEDPTPALEASAQGLVTLGADFLVIPCNTAHYFVERLSKKLKVLVYSMIDATVDYVNQAFPGIKKIGVLGTTGTLKTSGYKEALTAQGMEMLVPDAISQQKLVMESIYGNDGVKAGKIAGPKQRLSIATRQLQDQGAKVVIMACTEIPIAMRTAESTVPLLDPTEILAKAAVKKAMQI